MPTIDRSLYIKEALARYPQAKEVPVWNFAGTAPLTVPDRYPMTVREMNEANLQNDARSYGWNKQTIQAIQMALRNIYKANKL